MISFTSRKSFSKAQQQFVCGSIFLTEYTTRVLIEIPKTQFSSRNLQLREDGNYGGTGFGGQELPDNYVTAASLQNNSILTVDQMAAIGGTFSDLFKTEFESETGLAIGVWTFESFSNYKTEQIDDRYPGPHSIRHGQYMEYGFGQQPDDSAIAAFKTGQMFKTRRDWNYTVPAADRVGKPWPEIYEQKVSAQTKYQAQGGCSMLSYTISIVDAEACFDYNPTSFEWATKRNLLRLCKGKKPRIVGWTVNKAYLDGSPTEFHISEEAEQVCGEEGEA